VIKVKREQHNLIGRLEIPTISCYRRIIPAITIPGIIAAGTVTIGKFGTAIACTIATITIIVDNIFIEASLRITATHNSILLNGLI
jgi:hypothetical protein